MSHYKVFLDFDTYNKVRESRGKRKGELLQFLNSLAADPFQPGDLHTFRDNVRIEVKVFGKYSLLYYSDHAVKEVKILDFYRSGS